MQWEDEINYLHADRLQGVLDHQQCLLQKETMNAQCLVAEQNEAMQQHAVHLDAVLNDAQPVQQQRQLGQNFNNNEIDVMNYNHVPQEYTAAE